MKSNTISQAFNFLRLLKNLSHLYIIVYFNFYDLKKVETLHVASEVTW